MRSVIARFKSWFRDPGDPNNMWRIGPAIGVTLFFALGIAAFVIALAWQDMRPDFAKATVGDFLQLVTITLGVIAGGGGSVALVVAYRRQKVNERAEKRAGQTEQRLALAEKHAKDLSLREDERERTRLLNERFLNASAQLGHERAPVRLAGAHAMAHLADDWADQRQMCIDVLCSYLRDAGKEPVSRIMVKRNQRAVAWRSRSTSHDPAYNCRPPARP